MKGTPGNVYLDDPRRKRTHPETGRRCRSDRIVYGTDMLWFDEYQAVGEVLSAKISEDDMRNILCRNAQKILK